LLPFDEQTTMENKLSTEQRVATTSKEEDELGISSHRATHNEVCKAFFPQKALLCMCSNEQQRGRE